jgi:hypothetical protein
VQVSIGWTSTCAVKADDTIACWGANNAGQAPVVNLTPDTLPAAEAGVPYPSQTIAVDYSQGLHAPYSFDIAAGSLPNGLSLDSATGELAGTPDSAALGVFTFTVRAQDANQLAGTRVYSLTVWSSNKFETTTSLASSANPSPLGKAITFIVSVTSPTGTPTGVVTLTEFSTVLGTGPLVNGVATFINSSLNIGSHGLQAYYSGADNYLPSNDKSLTQIINTAETEVTLSSSSNPSTYGRVVTFTAAVTSYYGVPTGIVSLVEGANNVLGTAAVVDGVATYSLSTLSVGQHNIKARYGGNALFAASDSTLITQRVNDEPITGLSAVNDSPTAAGLTTVFSATIGSGTNVTYQWNFGDGRFGSKAMATHVYDRPGIYTTVVTATNSVGSLSATTTVTITAGNSIYIPLLLKM